jgi:hypothetical protein
MSNQRATFAKRQREADLRDKARAKQERRAAKRNEVRVTKGPEIAWDEAVRPVEDSDAPAPASDDPAPDPAPGSDPQD